MANSYSGARIALQPVTYESQSLTQRTGQKLGLIQCTGVSTYLRHSEVTIRNAVCDSIRYLRGYISWQTGFVLGIWQSRFLPSHVTDPPTVRMDRMTLG